VTAPLDAILAAVDGDRLWRRLEALARFGATPGGGVTRLALSAEEIAARRFLIDLARARGLAAFSDAAGNLFLRLEGARPDRPCVLTGSHVDSQPRGGRFDGAFGVMAGLEVLEAFLDAGATPPVAIEVVAWMNEEASRFAPGMMGSKAFVGEWDLPAMRSVADGAGVTVGEALDALDAAEPDVPKRPLRRPVACFVEAHIEQGPLLERCATPVGVVTGIQGTRRYRVTVSGAAGHAGTVPPGDRRDAMMAAARMIARIDAAAARVDGMMATCGMLRLELGAPSVIPAEAFFSIDIRHPQDAAVEEMDRAIEQAAAAAAGPCEIRIDRIARAPTLEFPEAMRRRIAEAAARAGEPATDIFSAAGHDARHLNAWCPTGMIFIPCRDGISHAETEWCDPADVLSGARVLAATLASAAWDPPGGSAP